jgi:hypothetical protein
VTKPIKPDKPDKPDKGKKKPHLRGVIRGMTYDPDSLVLRLRGRLEVFSVLETASVVIDDELEAFAGLEIGMHCQLAVDQAGAVVAVDARSSGDDDAGPDQSRPEKETVKRVAWRARRGE